MLYERCRCSSDIIGKCTMSTLADSSSNVIDLSDLPNTYSHRSFISRAKVQKKTKNQMAKSLQIISFLLWLIRSFLSIFIHLGFRLIYGNQKYRLPPITNQLLLQPAIVIAKRIRQRQVNSFERKKNKLKTIRHSFR